MNGGPYFFPIGGPARRLIADDAARRQKMGADPSRLWPELCRPPLPAGAAPYQPEPPGGYGKQGSRLSAPKASDGWLERVPRAAPPAKLVGGAEAALACDDAIEATLDATLALQPRVSACMLCAASRSRGGSRPTSRRSPGITSLADGPKRWLLRAVNFLG